MPGLGDKLRELVQSLTQKNRARAPGLLCLMQNKLGIACAYFLKSGELKTVEFLPASPEEQLSALNVFVAAQQLEGVSCTYVLQSSQYRLHLIDKPNVPTRELEQAARWNIKDLVGASSIEDFAVQVFSLPAVDRRASRVYVASMLMPEIHRIKAFVEQAGLYLQAINITELTMRNLMSLLPADAYGTALLYMTEDSMRLLITRKQQVCFTREIPDGRKIAKELHRKKKKEYSTQEKEKMHDDIVLAIQRSLDFYQSHLGEFMPATLYLDPHFKVYNALGDWLKKQLAIPVEYLDIPALISYDGTLDDEGGMHVMGVIAAGIPLSEIAEDAEEVSDEAAS